jgi:F0F1-type ATP synthase assembly protein I
MVLKILLDGLKALYSRVYGLRSSFGRIIALIIGLGSKVVSTLFALIMLGAIFKAKLAMGFLAGYELVLRSYQWQYLLQ